MRLIELNHVIEDGMVTYKGLPAPVICDYLSRVDSRGNYEAGTEFQIGRITMVSNTGTYLDTPFHRYADGDDLAAVALARVTGLSGMVGIVTGAPTPILRIIRSSPPQRPRCCAMAALRSSGSIRTI
jgi:kynurenine formamidase